MMNIHTIRHDLAKMKTLVELNAKTKEEAYAAGTIDDYDPCNSDAHELEDKLYMEFVQEIANAGRSKERILEFVEMANELLKSKQINFTRFTS